MICLMIITIGIIMNVNIKIRKKIIMSFNCLKCNKDLLYLICLDTAYYEYIECPDCKTKLVPFWSRINKNKKIIKRGFKKYKERKLFFLDKK